MREGENDSERGREAKPCEGVDCGAVRTGHRVASPLVWLVEGEEWWEAPDHPQVSSHKIGVETSQTYCHLHDAQS
ncbi:hypothetical protein TNCV_1661131 [Trichonephila clavipes]|nr:hypothetical protein TNCV_1661131 [Trichonephila clavipes]